MGIVNPRLPGGSKALNSTAVQGQLPHDEADRRTEPHSSVSDLANSLTSEMLMVGTSLSQCAKLHDAHGKVCHRISKAKSNEAQGKLAMGIVNPRLPGGSKALNSTAVQGQLPHDEADRRTEPHSSVSDLANSLTSEMLMLSPGSEDDDGHEGTGRENLGRIQFSVGYNFQDSTLTVKILKGQELPAKDFSGTSDPFVKIYLLPDKKNKLETKVKRKNLNPHWNETFLFEDPYVKLWLMHKDKRVEKKKTVVMKCCLNPVFNESFPFEIPTERLRETTIIITIYLSWKSGPGEVKHWKDMIGRPRQAVAQWHQLKA
ncbi:UNVERIFIED_CONTAM: hypothetical protein FKN15_022236 [Acipenser sinensis]